MLVGCLFEILDRNLCMRFYQSRFQGARGVRVYFAKIFPLEDFIECSFRPRRIFFRQGRMPSVEKVKFHGNDVPFSDWRKVVRQFTNGLHRAISISQMNQGRGWILPSGG